MADEGAVDVDEGREQPSGATARPPIAAGVGRLSPVQTAYSAYTRHAIDCDNCRDVDQTCATAETLWRAYREQGNAAYRRLAQERP